MWPSAPGSGGASNPIWGRNQPQNPGGSNPPSGGSWFGPNSGGGSNNSSGGWFAPNAGGSGGGSNSTPGFPGPGAGGWFGPSPNSGGSGGSSNPSPGGWFGPNSGGGSNPTPGSSGPSPGEGSRPSAGGWFGPTPGGGPNPAPGWPGSGPGGGSQPTTPSSRSSQVTPCFLDLPNGVYDGLLLTINGRIKAHPKKFTVDISTRNDIAFHFNPRFNDCGDRNVVVRNTCRGKRWEREERQLSHFPFSPNRNIEMKILCTNNEYKVAVDGSHLLTFKHRITNLRDIQKVSIYYDVENISIKAETIH